MSKRFHIARITLEAQSPVAISSGGSDPLHDNLLARDVNGLPILPATSIAGALRAQFSDKDGNHFFGHQNGDQGQRSAVIFSDGLLHWSDNAPRDGIIFDQTAITQDSVAKLCHKSAPVERQHARINESGVVDGVGKFTRAGIPKGARFTFEISAFKDGEAFSAICEKLTHGLFLGGATRSGFGAFTCLLVQKAVYDLHDPKDAKKFREIAGYRLDKPLPDEKTTHETSKGPINTWHLTGQIEGPLLIGHSSQDKQITRAPYEEQWIDWSSGKGACARAHFVVPASSIKGPLRHRTLFHLRKKGADSSLVDDLFGHAKQAGGGQAGALRFFDATPEGGQTITQTHVGLDRFTGGARDGVLFTDQMLWRPKITIRIQRLRDVHEQAEKAFKAAIDDLKNGLVGIGADWGDGCGVFETLEGDINDV